MKNINTKLISYVEANIFPIYNAFDKGHDLSHIKAVIERALKLADEIKNINYDIVYAAAALHDIGIKVQRKNHAYYSGLYVRQDKNLKDRFTDEETETIAQAVEDHSTSKRVEPRSIYGKIVCGADKDSDMEISLLRAYEYTRSYYPEYTQQECIDNVCQLLSYKIAELAVCKL